MKRKPIKVTLTPEAHDLLVKLTNVLNSKDDDESEPNVSPSWVAQDILVDYLAHFYKVDAEDMKIMPHGGRREGAGRKASE